MKAASQTRFTQGHRAQQRRGRVAMPDDHHVQRRQAKNVTDIVNARSRKMSNSDGAMPMPMGRCAPRIAARAAASSGSSGVNWPAVWAAPVRAISTVPATNQPRPGMVRVVGSLREPPAADHTSRAWTNIPGVPELVVPIRSRRRDLAQLLQKLQHVVPAAPLLFQGISRLQHEPHGWSLLLAAGEVGISVLVVGAFIRTVRAARRRARAPITATATRATASTGSIC